MGRQKYLKNLVLVAFIGLIHGAQAQEIVVPIADGYREVQTPADQSLLTSNDVGAIKKWACQGRPYTYSSGGVHAGGPLVFASATKVGQLT